MLLPSQNSSVASLFVALAFSVWTGCADDTPRSDDESVSTLADAAASSATTPRPDAGGSTFDAGAGPGDSAAPSLLDASSDGSSSVVRGEDGGRDGAAVDAAPTDPRDASAEAGPAPIPNGTCPASLLGWATVAGDGVSTTTGGGNAAPVRPKTAAELMMLAADETPRVIEIAGSFDVPRLAIASNKTLLGIGKDATIRGGLRIRGNSDAPVSNVIVRNLRIDGAKTQVDNDAVQLYFAHHVWIDHCEIWDGPDGNLDMTHAVNWVTVSWTKLRYSENYVTPSGESTDHRFASLVGHSDNNAKEDDGRLKVTFHHNHWAERVIERMPRVRFGQVHVFNNYFASPGNNYCVRAGRGAHLLIEQNHFDHVNSPHEFNSVEDEPTAHITARDNVYEGTTGTKATGGGGAPFTSVPYDAPIDPAESIPALVRACAGPR